jgi:hypothetical protein
MTVFKKAQDVPDRLKAMDERTQRFLSLLPRTGDPLVILLKGHLLLEEQLYSILRAWIPDSSNVEKARLSFNQKLYLARGIVGSLTTRNAWWDALQELNGIRNKLAHQTEPGDIDALTSELIKICESDDGFELICRKPVFHGITKLHNALLFLSSTLNALAAAVEVVRDHSSLPSHDGNRARRD